MQLRTIVVAVAHACYLIGSQWRNQQAIKSFSEKGEEAKAAR